MNVSCPQCSTIYRVDPAKVPPGGVRARCSTCSGVIPVGMRAVTPPRAVENVDAIGAAFGARPTPPPFVPKREARPAIPAREIPPPPRAATPPRPAAPVRTPTPPGPAPAVPPRPAASEGFGSPGATLPKPAPAASWPAAPAAPARPATPPRPVTPVSVPPVTPPPVGGPARDAGAGDQAGIASRRPINPFLARDPSLRAKRLARALVSDMVAYYPAKHSEGLEKGTLKELFRDEIKKSYDEYVAQVGADFARTTTHFQESLNEVLGAGKKIF
jgi:predicted Zn finger-like uncharacterized protein